jgi:hypothetical protein
LRQVDLDDKVSYYFIISVLFDGKTPAGIQLFPTRTNQEITIVLPTRASGNNMLQILDVNGRLIQQQVVNQESTQEKINVSKLPAGTYFVTIQMGSTQQTGRFIKF